MARKASGRGTGSHAAAAKEYVLGTNAAELDRLGFQHQLWSDAAHAAWQRAGIKPGMAVLDVGCGPGFASFDLTQIVGSAGRVIGIDQSGQYLEHLRAQAGARGLGNLRAYEGDVNDLGSHPDVRREAEGPRPGFDLAWARWVLCFVNRPADVVRGVASLLKPGGKWCIHDYFNYEAMCTAPRSPAFEKAAKATGVSWRERGGDPDIMSRVPGMLTESGFEIEHLEVHQRIARPGDTMWAWPERFWTYYLGVMVEMGHLTATDRQAWLDEWAELSLNPNAYVVLPAVYEIIAVRSKPVSRG